MGVKGPGDRLSTKQILWVRFLNSVGLPAEVCHVVATGSKGIVGTSSAPSLEVKEKGRALVRSNSEQGVADEKLGNSDNPKVVKKKKRVQHGRGKHIAISIEEEDCD